MNAREDYMLKGGYFKRRRRLRRCNVGVKADGICFPRCYRCDHFCRKLFSFDTHHSRLLFRRRILSLTTSIGTLVASLILERSWTEYF